MDNVPALRRKLQRVQVSNLNLTREVERAERMLKAQVKGSTESALVFTRLGLVVLQLSLQVVDAVTLGF